MSKGKMSSINQYVRSIHLYSANYRYNIRRRYIAHTNLNLQITHNLIKTLFHVLICNTMGKQRGRKMSMLHLYIIYPLSGVLTSMIV